MGNTYQTLALITLTENSIETIKQIPDLPKREMEFVNNGKQKAF